MGYVLWRGKLFLAVSAPHCTTCFPRGDERAEAIKTVSMFRFNILPTHYTYTHPIHSLPRDARQNALEAHLTAKYPFVSFSFSLI